MVFRRPVPASQRIARRIVDTSRNVTELAASVPKTVAPIVAGQVEQITSLLGNYLLKTDAANTYSVLAHKHAASDITSGGTTGTGFTVGGALAVNGAVTAGGTVSGPTGTFNTALNSLGAYSNNITTTRAALWISNAGSVGVTTSSERFKQDIIKADIDPLAILKMDVDLYHYKAEIAKRDDPTSPDYVGPDYHVHTEVGMIAERLHEAGLWPFVIYEREDVTETHQETQTLTDENGDTVDVTTDVTTVIGDRLKLDAAGQPIPFSIHYDLWALAVHVATQHLASIAEDHETRIAALEKAVNVGVHT